MLREKRIYYAIGASRQVSFLKRWKGEDQQSGAFSASSASFGIPLARGRRRLSITNATGKPIGDLQLRAKPRCESRSSRLTGSPSRRKWEKDRSGSALEGRAELRDHETSGKCQWLQVRRCTYIRVLNVSSCVRLEVESYYPRILSRGLLSLLDIAWMWILSFAAERGDCTLRADNISPVLQA